MWNNTTRKEDYMGKIYKSAADLIGNTPLVEVGHIEEKFGLKQEFLLNLSISMQQEALRTELQRQ